MEKLLNELIKKGWKPFKIKSDNMWLYCLKDNKIVISYYVLNTEGEWDHEDKRCSYRELVSKESGLWQFVCKNGMIKSETGVWVNAVDGMYKEILINQYDYRYRLIESSLKDESELEDFLLSNIVIKDEE